MGKRLPIPAALAALVAAMAATVTAAGPPKILDTITVTVGPGSTIALADSHGKRVVVLGTGLYRFVIDHETTKDNFHVVGPKGWRGFYQGASEGASALGLTGVRVRRLWVMIPGVYRYYSDAHASIRGSFRVVRRAPGHGAITAAKKEEPR